MKAPLLLSRLRSWLTTGATDPVGYYGSNYAGAFEAQGSRISGTVGDANNHHRYPPASIVVLRDHVTIGSTTQLERRGRAGWRFAFDVASPITPQDILQDRIKVFALDRRGERSALKIVGAVQLEFLRNVHGEIFEQEILIEFRQGGNSKEYTRDGWYGSEPEHVWTAGTSSTIAVTFKHPGTRYCLDMLLGAFVVRDRIPSQTLMISIAGILIGKFYPGPGQHSLECDIPPELTLSGEAIIHFDHPDAARPIDFEGGSDPRTLGIAFRRLRLKRYLETPGEPAADQMAGDGPRS